MKRLFFGVFFLMAAVTSRAQTVDGRTHQLDFFRCSDFGTAAGIVPHSAEVLESVRLFVEEYPDFIQEVDSYQVVDLNNYYQTNDVFFKFYQTNDVFFKGKLVSGHVPIQATVYRFQFRQKNKIQVQVVFAKPGDSLKILQTITETNPYENNKSDQKAVIDKICNSFGTVLQGLNGLTIDTGITPYLPKSQIIVIRYDRVPDISEIAGINDSSFLFAPVIIQTGSELGTSRGPTGPQVLLFPVQRTPNLDSVRSLLATRSRKAYYSSEEDLGTIVDKVYARTDLSVIQLKIQSAASAHDGQEYDIYCNGIPIATNVVAEVQNVLFQVPLAAKTKNTIVIYARKEGLAKPFSLLASIDDPKLKRYIRIKKDEGIGFILERD